VTSWTYILQSLPWTIAGALVGFFMGRSTVAVQVIAEAVQEGDDMPEPARVPLRRRVTPMHVIGAVVVVLGIFTAVQGYVQSEATERLTLCTQAYSNGFADAIEERSKASAEAQDALDEFFFTLARVAPSAEGREQMRQAFDAYVAKRSAAKKTQAEHPYPAPPRDVC
jgi:hypothetical protein